MKKLFFIVLFLLFTTSLFAQITRLRTSEGVYEVSIRYEGEYMGQQLYNRNIAAAKTSRYLLSLIGNYKLTKGQLEAVEYMLNRYETTEGDTFFITICPSNNTPSNSTRIDVYVEFTSDSLYNYWAFRSQHDYGF